MLESPIAAHSTGVPNHNRLASAIGFLGLALLPACGPPGPAPTTEDRSALPTPASPTEPWFEEVAAAADVNFTYQTGQQPGKYLMPEIKGGGVGLFDYDRDGWLDILCVQGGSLHPEITHRPGPRLFRNLGNWQFQDVTDQANISSHGSYGMGCALNDYDGDGWPDILINHVDGPRLYRNLGDGTFREVTETAGLSDRSWGVSAAFFDYDDDGWLDLAIANYLVWSIEAEVTCYSRGGLPDYCSPLSYNAPAITSLYHNLGNGQFEFVSHLAGLDRAYGHGLGVICADFDRDGRQDLYVANDATPNQLWINLGNGKFEDQAMIRGCAVNAIGMPEAGMGITSADLDHNGWRDLFITHLVGEANRLYMNHQGYFSDTVLPRGPGAPSWPLTSFGVGFFDFDHDGLFDLFVSNGRVKRGVTDLDPDQPYIEPNLLLRGEALDQFEIVPNAGTAQPLLAAGRGAAFGDLDNDGDIDIVVVNRDTPLHLLKNVAPKRGNSITLRLVNRHGRMAVGADVRLDAGDRSWWRAVAPHESYGSSNDPRVHCGLGNVSRVDQILVRWPGGQSEWFGPLAANQEHQLREGTGTPAAPTAANSKSQSPNTSL